jgi:phytoene synthase
LQLINHWQDVGIDAAKPVPRIYLPGEDLAYYDVPEADILRRTTTTDFRSLMRFQVDRARKLMLEGEALGWTLPGRVGLEIRVIVAGGLRILEKIEAVDYDVFQHRPVLTKRDWPRLLWRAI